MIDEIHVENIALIREADLVPGPGMTVLTGETGSGKTALLSALKLLMGERADLSAVREGARCALVSGRIFRGPHDTEGLTVERRIGSDGRTRVRIDGAMASVREQADLVRPCIDLCGQHEHQRLLDAVHHVDMVDAWAGSPVASVLNEYRELLSRARAAQRELERVEAASRTQGAKLEEARFTLGRIQEVDPAPGEFEQLEEVLPRAEHAEALAATAHEASEALSGEGATLDSLNCAIAELARMGRVDSKLSDLADQLSSAAIAIEDAASELVRYREDIEFDPEELARLQERYAQIKGLLRQWGPRMEDVFAARDEAQELLGLVDNAEAGVRRAREKRDEVEAALAEAARELTRRRNAAAPKFCREVAKQMARLEMGRAELVWQAKELPRAKWTDRGPCECELLYRSAPGLTPRPLRRIASGGELSRVMLAVKVVMGDADGVDTLVFDEVDAGVGGATARSLAAVLADLAQTHQVIVVTHLVQVAVQASVHYVVSKTSGDVPETLLTRVAGNDRVREISRLLSGDTSEASVEHAKQLLLEAGQL